MSETKEKLCKDCKHCRIPMISDADPAQILKRVVGGITPKIPNPNIRTWECTAVRYFAHRNVDGTGMEYGVHLCIDKRGKSNECYSHKWIEKGENK